MTPLRATAIAAAAAAGAASPTALPLWMGVALAVVALAGRWWWLAALGIGLLCSSLAHRSWAGLEPLGADTRAGVVTAVSDAERSGGQTRVVVRLGDDRFHASGWGPLAAALEAIEAGDRVWMSGKVTPYGGSRERQAALHVADRLQVDQVGTVSDGAVIWRIANSLRHAMADGAASLGQERRGLFTGLVYGDDRAQAPLVAADFRVAGLTHLLAVSGQNVAFLLALLGPLLVRLPRSPRLVAALVALGLFAVMTRLEPSVLRATFMAGLALLGRWSGRDVATSHLLPTAVTVLLVIDPLLIETVAFQLSVAASAGILVVTPLIAARLPHDGPISEALAVTLGAQLAVAPLLTHTFGPVSLATVPANLLAGPAAGLVMVWGMTAGVVAGMVGGPVAAAIHQPTRALLWWLETVAHHAGHPAIPSVGSWWILAACASWMVWHQLRRRGSFVHRCALVVGVGTLVATAGVDPSAGPHRVGWDSTVVIDPVATVLVLGEERDVVAVLDDLRSLDVTAVDLLVLTGGANARPVMDQLQQRVPVAERWVAAGDRWPPDPKAVAVGQVVRVDLRATHLVVTPTGSSLSVTFEAVVTAGG